MSGLFFVQLQPALSEWCQINVEIIHCQQISINNLQPHVIRCRWALSRKCYLAHLSAVCYCIVTLQLQK